MVAENLSLHHHVGLRLYWVTQCILGVLLGLHALIYVVAPFKSIYPMLPVWAALGGFLVVFAVMSRLTLGRTQTQLEPPHLFGWLDGFTSDKLLIRLTLISVVGLCFHVFAKYYLTHLRPVHCLFEIRFAWIEVPHSMLPWFVRIASVLGHLLTAFAYFGVFIASLMTIRTYEHTKQRWRHLIYLLVFMLIGTIYAGFIGSRNAMLAYLVMAFAGVVLGLCLQSFTWRKALNAGVITCVLPFLMAAGFSTAVFSNRIFCDANAAPIAQGVVQLPVEKNTQAVAAQYLLANCKAFAIECYQDGYGKTVLERFLLRCSTCGSTMLYLEHGIINFSQIVAAHSRGDPVLFRFFQTLPTRFGLAYIDEDKNAPDSRVYGPGGTTFAGAAYHDYGISGVLLSALVLGTIYGWMLRLINGKKALSLGVWLYVGCFYILMTSNIFVGSNAMPFPFILFGSGITIAAVTMARNTRISALCDLVRYRSRHG